ncbi:rhomboid family intramembrane serine protease [Halorubrum sp. Ea1]|uniref:rhomboid family intramembrane serine protease n=1 Tax=Halorubrum sp. Ea1 TaxID=1480718 RepID=UPI00159598CB|nr:rhomboid family intramembrane serine protease [Halorubrum sp. Ea1]
MSVDLEIDQPSTPGQSEDSTRSGRGYIGRILAGPGVSLVLMAVVSLATWTGVQANNVDPFVLQAPLTEDWWQLPLSVFSHSGMPHLTGNATMIALFGSIAVFSSSVIRYHTFFIISGMIAGAAQVLVTGAIGDPGSVLGASGAGMALMMYVLISNDISSLLLNRVSRTAAAGLVVAAAVAITLWSAAIQIANVAHLAGALIGGVAGYFHLLRSH